MNTILHITRGEKWKQAQLAGMYRADSLDSEGFIHCSTPKQIIKVANNFFANQKGLVLLFIDSDQVKAEIRYEAAEVDELFPHIYGALNIDAVFKFVDFNPGKDGFFQMCPELQKISE
ncbi:DUF952 domain-containing protein [Fischerella sp. PCC 9605]|uniref:DUF952 domain-containing protein n=1 Tax=Fischerella sp. PCC 9605 TaxID=1173024 RepID=UPI00047A5DA4|nr:DUF952 domain-containing protein [Fischerella sp. PCC 9605]